MIRIQYRYSDNICFLLLSGHAGYDNPGRDIVCAGVSALTYALINLLDEQNPDGYEREIRPDETRIQFPCDGTTEKFILTGYRMMQDHYPGYVELKKI